MTLEVCRSRASFPKDARLLKRRDFTFTQFHRFRTESFNFVYSRRKEISPDGPGSRLGVSLSKKVLRRAVARNRIRRLIREVFRTRREAFPDIDLHVIGLQPLSETWRLMNKSDIEDQFDEFLAVLRRA
jgi:ribonuclease P protein component